MRVSFWALNLKGIEGLLFSVLRCYLEDGESVVDLKGLSGCVGG